MPNSRESARGTEPRATLEEKATPQSASLTLIVDKPLVCQRICPTACLRTALALRRRGVPWLCTALRSVCSPLQPFGPPTASGRGGNAFFPQTQAFALQKMPEMTYTPSFLIRASFFRYFVNTLNYGAVSPLRQPPQFMTKGFSQPGCGVNR